MCLSMPVPTLTVVVKYRGQIIHKKQLAFYAHCPTNGMHE
jgi:hypothetical protein